jgi:hypothetical protein
MPLPPSSLCRLFFRVEPWSNLPFLPADAIQSALPLPPCALPCSPSPSPNPTAGPTLALLSDYPSSYTGPTANLTAISTTNDACVEAPSIRLRQNGVTFDNPGAALCGTDGSMPAGSYTLGQNPPAGVVFEGWECYNVSGDVPVQFPVTTTFTLSGTIAVTCAAIYTASSTPPSPTPGASPNPASGPKLALISEFPASYNGSSADLTATSSSNVTCEKAPSPRLGRNGVSIQDPGPGLCNTDGSMPPGTYNLQETAPSAVEFDGWDCYEVSGTSPITLPVTANVALTGNMTVTCVATYILAQNPPAAPSPSPLPNPRPSPNPSPSPSPAPAPLPKLALLSDYPASYIGPTANLTAVTAGNDSCVAAPSTRLGVANATVVSPGAGWCNTDGSVDPGVYNLQQVAPPGTIFANWQCFDVSNGVATLLPVNATNPVALTGSMSVTCLAVYVVAAVPSPSPRYATTGITHMLAWIGAFGWLELACFLTVGLAPLRIGWDSLRFVCSVCLAQLH